MSLIIINTTNNVFHYHSVYFTKMHCQNNSTGYYKYADGVAQLVECSVNCFTLWQNIRHHNSKCKHHCRSDVFDSWTTTSSLISQRSWFCILPPYFLLVCHCCHKLQRPDIRIRRSPREHGINLGACGWMCDGVVRSRARCCPCVCSVSGPRAVWCGARTISFSGLK